MSLVSVQAGSELVSALLRGSQLDSIRAYSLIVQLGFIRAETAEGLPGEIWLSVSGNLVVTESSSNSTSLERGGDFFQCRALALPATYLLIGHEVTAASISETGSLRIDLGARSVHVESYPHEGLEEVWAVMSDSPSTTADHPWYISLDDTGALSADVPD